MQKLFHAHVFERVRRKRRFIRRRRRREGREHSFLNLLFIRPLEKKLSLPVGRRLNRRGVLFIIVRANERLQIRPRYRPRVRFEVVFPKNKTTTRRRTRRRRRSRRHALRDDAIQTTTETSFYHVVVVVLVVVASPFSLSLSRAKNVSESGEGIFKKKTLMRP